MNEWLCKSFCPGWSGAQVAPKKNYWVAEATVIDLHASCLLTPWCRVTYENAHVSPGDAHGQQCVLHVPVPVHAVCMMHNTMQNGLSLTFFCNCLLYDWYTCQYLHRESGNVHVFVLGTMGWAACKNICTTSHSCYGNACCAILRQNKQSGIELTKRHLEDKMHQAQAEVNGMAMASKAEDLNYLSDVAKREEFGCFPTGCLITCIFDCVSWSSENCRPIWSHCCAPLGSQFNNLKSDCKSVSSLAKDKKKS